MKSALKARRLLFALLLLLCCQGMAQAEQSWRASFEDTCARSNEAMKMSVQELNALLEKCTALEKVIGSEEESVRKVYLKRLQMCKNLYAYVLDYKKNTESAR